MVLTLQQSWLALVEFAKSCKEGAGYCMEGIGAA